MERFDYGKNDWKSAVRMMHSQSNFSAVGSSDGKFINAFGGFNGTHSVSWSSIQSIRTNGGLL
jgi:hypothetical protein